MALDSKLTEAIENAKIEINQTISSIQSQLQANIDAANSRIDAADQAIAALTERVTITEDNITSINTQISQMSEKYDKAIQELWIQVNANTADIKALSARLDAFIASSDGHYKVDMIPAFTIPSSSWTTEGSNAVYTVTNDFLVDCVVAEVDYDAQYDITPTYIVDSQAGTLKILIPSSQAQTVTVSDIICYHIASDDEASDETQKVIDDKDKIPVVDSDGAIDQDTPIDDTSDSDKAETDSTLGDTKEQETENIGTEETENNTSEEKSGDDVQTELQ